MLRIREIAEDELQELVDVSKAAMPREQASVSIFVDWREQAGEMVWLLAERDGETVGAGFALTGWHTPPHRAIGSVLVPPDRRGFRGRDRLAGRDRGLGRRPRRERAGRRGQRGRRGQPRVGVPPRLHRGRTQLEARARPDRHRSTRPCAPGRHRDRHLGRAARARAGMYEVAREAVPDIPGEEEDDIGTLEEWLARDMRGDSDDPKAVFIAVAGGDVAGFAKLSLMKEQSERAFHDLTGVKRAYRGHGIAAALKRTQIAWAKSNGYTSLQTSNEVRNEPIRRLNERHGYVLEPGVVIVRSTISGG